MTTWGVLVLALVVRLVAVDAAVQNRVASHGPFYVQYPVDTHMLLSPA